MPSCWFANLPHAGPCDGTLRRCHLIPRQLLVHEFGEHRGERLADDPRTWVPGCGGSMGISGHHGQLDYSRTLRVPRDRLPAAVEAVADELGLGWWLDREYGEREVVT